MPRHLLSILVVLWIGPVWAQETADEQATAEGKRASSPAPDESAASASPSPQPAEVGASASESDPAKASGAEASEAEEPSSDVPQSHPPADDEGGAQPARSEVSAEPANGSTHDSPAAAEPEGAPTWDSASAEAEAQEAMEAELEAGAAAAEEAARATERRASKVPEAKATTEEVGLRFDGYLRTEFGTYTPKRLFFVRMPAEKQGATNPYVGRNDGFALGGARLNLRATYGDLYIRLGFDGAVVSYDDPESPAGELSTGLKDAYARYDLWPWLKLAVGRFKPPFESEQLTPQTGQMFVHRSVESRGVLRHEGYSGDVHGFSTGRQLGFMLSSDRALRVDTVDLGYGLAVTNGNSGVRSLNDNDLPALWLRLTAAWTDDAARGDEEGPATYGLGETSSGVLVGLSGFYNPATFGEAPNRYDDDILGAGLDVAVQMLVFQFQGQVLWSRTNHVLRAGAASEHSFGGHAQLGIVVPQTTLVPAYRFGYYNPRWVPGSAFDQADYDAVMHHTLGLRYTLPALPLTLWAEYTRSVEQAGRAIPNDRIEAAMQVDFE